MHTRILVDVLSFNYRSADNQRGQGPSRADQRRRFCL